jgi:hypothetical protein
MVPAVDFTFDMYMPRSVPVLTVSADTGMATCT